MNPPQPIGNPFLKEITTPILTKSQQSELYAILAQGKGYLDVFGECGMGKTTILKSLGRVDVENVEGLGQFRFLVCIYLNCTTKVISQSPDEFWKIVFEELERKSLNISDLEKFERSNKGLESIMRLLAKQSKSVLLILDEFEGLIPTETTNPQITRNFLTELRGLVTHDPSAILVIGTRCGLTKLWEIFANPGGASEFPNNSTRFLLGRWKEAEFESFLERSKIGNQPGFSKQEMRFIENLSCRHPGLTQRAARIVFNERLDQNTRNLAESNLANITEKFIADTTDIYKEIWRGMDEEERLIMTIIALKIAQGKIPGANYSLSKINPIFEQKAIILRELMSRHILVNPEENSDRNLDQPFSPFFSQWIIEEIVNDPPDSLENRLRIYGGLITQGQFQALKNAVNFFYENRENVVKYTKEVIKIAIKIGSLPIFE